MTGARFAALELAVCPVLTGTLHRGLSDLSIISDPSAGDAGCGRRPQPSDERPNFPEHLTGHRDLGHLKRDVAAVADHLGVAMAACNCRDVG